MKDIHDNLQKLGLTQYESRAYAALLRSPKVTAYELAKESGIPPSKVYEVLERLRSKQLVGVVETGGSPRYAPLDPREAVARYRRTYDDLLDGLEERLEGIYSSDKVGNGYVWNLQGREAVMAKAVEMIEEASEEILLAAWPDQLPRLEVQLVAADDRGVKIAVCLYGEGDPGVGVVYHHPTDRVVRQDQGAQRMVLVVDTSEALIGYFPEAGVPDGVWSANLGFVQMAKDYVRHDMWVIKLVRRFEQAINDAYGSDRARLRDIYDLDHPEIAVTRAASDNGNSSAAPPG
jgi:sugar-specific transcriptional regulator TrmB